MCNCAINIGAFAIKVPSRPDKHIYYAWQVILCSNKGQASIGKCMKSEVSLQRNNWNCRQQQCTTDIIWFVQLAFLQEVYKLKAHIHGV